MPELKDIKDNTPNTDLVRQLEKLLSEAKKGEMRSMLSVVGWNNNAVTHGWAIDQRTSKRMLLSEIEMAKHDLVMCIEVEERDSVLLQYLNDE